MAELLQLTSSLRLAVPCAVSWRPPSAAPGCALCRIAAPSVVCSAVAVAVGSAQSAQAAGSSEFSVLSATVASAHSRRLRTESRLILHAFAFPNTCAGYLYDFALGNWDYSAEVQ